MTIAKRLHLMLALTILFDFSSMLSIIQLSKVIHFQHLNFLYLKNVSELLDILENHPQKPLITSEIIKRLETIRKQPSECSSILNPIDRFTMKMIKTDIVITLCENNIDMVIEEVNRHKAPMIIGPVLIDTIYFTTQNIQ